MEEQRIYLYLSVLSPFSETTIVNSLISVLTVHFKWQFHIYLLFWSIWDHKMELFYIFYSVPLYECTVIYFTTFLLMDGAVVNLSIHILLYMSEYFSSYKGQTTGVFYIAINIGTLSSKKRASCSSSWQDGGGGGMECLTIQHTDFHLIPLLINLVTHSSFCFSFPKK